MKSSERSTRFGTAASAFTLLEVMFATAIFFMGVFLLLAVVSSGLKSARMMQQTSPDASVLAAHLSLTNRVTEGPESGDFDLFYPGMYPEYTWSSDTYEAATNGLYRVDFVVYKQVQGRTIETPMSILLWRPESTVGSTGSRFRR